MNITGLPVGVVYIPTQLIAPSVPASEPISLPTPDGTSDPTPHGTPFVQMPRPERLDLYL